MKDSLTTKYLNNTLYENRHTRVKFIELLKAKRKNEKKYLK